MTDPSICTSLVVDHAIGAGAVRTSSLREFLAGVTLFAAFVAGADQTGLGLVVSVCLKWPTSRIEGGKKRHKDHAYDIFQGLLTDTILGAVVK